ncbi:serine hydrolase domain-containing protein [Aquirufa regiilacus]
MNKKRSVFWCFFLLISSTISAQNVEALRTLMQSKLLSMGKNPVHSIQVYISKGDTVFNEAVGFSDGKNIIADKHNQYKIASITKTMTSVVILQLQEEGKLNIENPISAYLQDSKIARINDLHYFNGLSYGNSITLKQLLQHRSGLADIFTDASFRFYLNEYLNKKQEWNAEKLMHRYYKYGLNTKTHFPPDSGYYYSDVNYFLLGLIIEKITGETLAQQFRRRVFEPLQMSQTYFEYYEPVIGSGKLAHSFLGKRDITKILNTSYDWAGGGVVSTNADLAIFLRGIFEGKLYKKDSTLSLMTTMLPHTLKSGRVSYYGLGLYQYTFNGEKYYGHGGFWGSIIAYNPSNKVIFCGTVNQVNPPFKTNQFVESLLSTF